MALTRPDYAKIAQLKRELGLASPVDMATPPGLVKRLQNALMPWTRTQSEIEQRIYAKAMGAIAQAVAGDDDLVKAVGGVMPGSAYNNTGGPGLIGAGGAGSRLVSRLTNSLASAFQMPPENVEAALARQGLSWGPPFPPGRPLNPFWGYRRPPRTRDFQVGENTQIVPRWGRISFQTLKALWGSYDVAQICTKHLINDVRSLDYHYEAARGVVDDVSDDIRKAHEFMDIPDKRQPFRQWLSEYLTDVIRYDAGTLYVRRNVGGDPIALEIVSGETIIPIVDYFGRVATDEDDTDPKLSPAGLFEGKTTPGFVQIIQGMPWDWLAADDIIYQPLNPQPDSQYGLAPLEAVLLTANTDIRFQWHFLQYFTEGTIPQGFMEAPEGMSDPVQIAEWQQVWDALMMGDQAMLRRIRWVPFGAKYTQVGPGSKANKEFDQEFPLYLMRRTCAAHGVTPADLGFTETVNKATSEVQVDVQFRVGTLPLVRYVEDVINVFLQQSLKLRVQLRFDVGREIEDRLATAQAEQIYINTGVLSPDEPRARLGYPVSKLRPTPRFVQNTRSGPIPLIGIESISGPIDRETFGPTKDAPQIEHPFHEVPGVMPPIGSRAYTESQNAAALMQENMIALETKGGGKDGKGKGDKKSSGGRPGGGGGGGFVDPKLGPQLQGNKPAKERYGSDGVPDVGTDLTHPKLDTRKPKTASNKPKAASKPKKSVKKGENVTFGAGIALVAQDTGRVLMLQRNLKDEKKKSAGKWEFPGGIPESDESSWDAAKREWQEETGNLLPLKGAVTCTWNEPDGTYTLFVYAVRYESDILLNPDRDDMTATDPDEPNAFQTDPMAWWEVDDILSAGKAIRKELRKTDFDWNELRSAAKFDLKKEGAGAGAATTGGAPVTTGITSESGMTGVDLVKPDDDDDDDEATKTVLRQWKENAKNRLRKGLPPRRFVDPELPLELQERVWSLLAGAGSRDQIDRAFDLG